LFAFYEFEIFHFLIFSLLSSRDSTYRDDDARNIDELNGMGKIAKSSSCSSFIIDILFRGIFKKGNFSIYRLRV
jgi:hypothetical protein